MAHQIPEPIGSIENHPYYKEQPEDEFWRDVYLLAMRRGDDDPAIAADLAVADRRLRGRGNFGTLQIILQLFKLAALGLLAIMIISALMSAIIVAEEYARSLRDVREQNEKMWQQREQQAVATEQTETTTTDP